MRQEAEANAEADRRRKELIEVRNQADNTIYTSEKMLREHGDKVPADVKTKIEEGINRLRQTMTGEDVEVIKRDTEQLGRDLQAIGASMYEQQGNPNPEQPDGSNGGPQGDQGPGGEDGVDGEFRNA